MRGGYGRLEFDSPSLCQDFDSPSVCQDLDAPTVCQILIAIENTGEQPSSPLPGSALCHTSLS